MCLLMVTCGQWDNVGYGEKRNWEVDLSNLRAIVTLAEETAKKTGRDGRRALVLKRASGHATLNFCLNNDKSNWRWKG